MIYRREIDGLRAVAVLPVILFHGGFETFSGGYVGVDVFFVISGYLITSILIREMEDDRFSILRFYERRARRLLPALFLVLGCCLPFAWLWMMPSQLEEFARGLVAVVFFAANFLLWQRSDYFAAPAEEDPLLHMWTLAVEEQFYIFFPVLLLVLWRYGRRSSFALVCILTAASLLLSEWGWRNHPSANFFLLPTRAWELGAGAICAFLLHRSRLPGRPIFAAFGLAVIVAAVFAFDPTTPFPSVFALAPVGGSVLLILYASAEAGVGRILASRALVGIGLISYSAYLWHQPLFAFARIRHLGQPPDALMASLALATLALAYLSWRFVELPFRSGPRVLLPRQRQVFAAAAMSGFVLVAFGALGARTDGMIARFAPDEAREDYFASASSSPYRERCHASDHNRLLPEEACHYGADPAPVAVFGDSHTVELALALARELRPSGAGVRHYSYSGCFPPYGDHDGDLCRRWTRDVMRHIAGTPSIRHVVVSYRIHAALKGEHEEVYPGLPDETTPDRQREVLDALEGTLQELVDAGKEVIFVDQAPELPVQIEEIILRAPKLGDTLPGVPRAWWDRRTRPFHAAFELPAGVAQVRTTDLFCDATRCAAGRDGTAYYFDDDHLSVAGAAVVAEEVAGRITGGS